MASTLLVWPAAAARFGSANAPAATYRAGSNYPSLSLAFALNEKVYFYGITPQSYTENGAVTFKIHWESGTGTSGSATWGVKHKALADDEVFDAALSAQTTQADAVTAVADLQIASVAVASPVITAGELLVIEVELTSALTGGDALLHAVELQED